MTSSRGFGCGGRGQVLGRVTVLAMIFSPQVFLSWAAGAVQAQVQSACRERFVIPPGSAIHLRADPRRAGSCAGDNCSPGPTRCTTAAPARPPHG